MKLPTNIADFSTGQVRVSWSLIFGAEGYYVEERILDDAHKLKWGPMPSKAAGAVIVQERMRLVRDTLANSKYGTVIP